MSRSPGRNPWAGVLLQPEHARGTEFTLLAQMPLDHPQPHCMCGAGHEGPADMLVLQRYSEGHKAEKEQALRYLID